jgi:hypothetical protein
MSVSSFGRLYIALCDHINGVTPLYSASKLDGPDN